MAHPVGADSPVVVLYGALNLQVRRLLRGPDAARKLEALLDLAEELGEGERSVSSGRRK